MSDGHEMQWVPTDVDEVGNQMEHRVCSTCGEGWPCAAATTMPDPTTPPPLDDREKVARAIHEQVHRHEFRDRGCGLTTYDQRLADAVLAVLDLPARDRNTARAALTGLADHVDQTASRFVGIKVHSQKAQDVIDYRDAAYPTQEAPDAR